MLFHIEADEGTRIVGWLMPDNPGETPAVIVLSNEQELEVSATIARLDVIEILRESYGFHHATAIIGFVIDETVLPNLAQIQDLRIITKDGRVPIYRRFQIARHLEKHLVYFDVAAMPQRRIQRGFNEHFTLCYPNAERYPMETLLAIINNRNANSVLISGRPLFSRHLGSFRDRGYILAALLRDPYEELAERLVFIGALARSKAAHLLPVFLSDAPDLIEFVVSGIPFGDQKAITAKFRSATPNQREAMISPMTRLFACGIGEMPQHRHISIALENLAGIDLVGVRSRYSNFRSLLSSILGQDVLATDSLEIANDVRDTREMLSQIGVVSDLLEHDLNLYEHVSRAVNEGVDGIQP